MTLQIPPALQWVAYLTGSAWPKGDEDAMFRLSEYWHDSAGDLRALIPELDAVRKETTTALSGQTADAAEQNFAMLFDGDYSVAKLVDAMTALGGLAREGGTQIEYAKLQIIFTLAISAAEIAYAIACAPETLGGSMAWIPPIEAATMIAVRQFAQQLLKRLMSEAARAISRTAVKSLVRHAAVEAVQEGAQEFLQEVAIQGIQKAEGHRDGLDWGQIKKNAIGGAAGGAGAGAAHLGIGHVLGDSSNVLGKMVKGGATGYGAGVVGNVLGSIASEGGLTAGGLDPLSVFGGAATSGISGALHGSGHGSAPPRGEELPPEGAPPDGADKVDSAVGTGDTNDHGAGDDAAWKLGDRGADGGDAAPAYTDDARPPAYVSDRNPNGPRATPGGRVLHGDEVVGAQSPAAMGTAAVAGDRGGAPAANAERTSHVASAVGAATEQSPGESGTRAIHDSVAASADGHDGAYAHSGPNATTARAGSTEYHPAPAPEAAASVGASIAPSAAPSPGAGTPASSSIGADTGQGRIGVPGHAAAATNAGASPNSSPQASSPSTAPAAAQSPANPTSRASSSGVAAHNATGGPLVAATSNPKLQVTVSSAQPEGASATTPRSEPAGAAVAPSPAGGRPADVRSTAGVAGPGPDPRPAATRGPTAATPHPGALRDSDAEVQTSVGGGGGPDQRVTVGDPTDVARGRRRNDSAHNTMLDGPPPSELESTFIRSALRKVSGREPIAVAEAEAALMEYRQWARARGRTAPTNVTRLAYEVAHFAELGEVPGLPGGAAGFEGEIHGYRVTLPPGTHSDDFDHVVETPMLSLALDDAQFPVLEIVTRPAAVVPGDRGRPSSQQLADAVQDVLRRLRAARPGAPLSSIFAGEPYSVDPSAEGLQVHRQPVPTNAASSAGTEDLYVHHSVGVPLAGLPEFLQGVSEITRVEGGASRAAKSHLDDGLRMATNQTSNLGPQMSIAGRSALQGFLALTYTQFAALAQGIHNSLWLTKNYAAASPRTSLARLADGLEPAARQYLDHNAANLIEVFAETFQDHVFHRPVQRELFHGRIPRRWRNDDSPRPTFHEYLMGAFSSDPNWIAIGQDAAMGIRTTLPQLDANPDSDGENRINPPLVVMELRYLGPHRASATSVAHTHEDLSSRARNAFRTAQRRHGMTSEVAPAVPAAPPAVIRAASTSVVSRHRQPSSQLDPGIDPFDVASVQRYSNQPSDTVHYRTGDQTDRLYRYDVRPPEVVFELGLMTAPAGFGVDSVLVKTWLDDHRGVAAADSKSPPRYRYTIDAPGGIDIARSRGFDHYSAGDVGFPGGIRRENILGVAHVMGTETGSAAPTWGDLEPNPHFEPHRPNDIALPMDQVGGGHRTLEVRFAQTKDSLDVGQVERIRNFAAYVSQRAENQYAIGNRSRIRVSAEGGGNGGPRSRGPMEVGRTRAAAVLRSAHAEIARELRERGLPDDLVAVPEEGSSRGRRPPTGSTPASSSDRRVVVVHLEDWPRTTDQLRPPGLSEHDLTYVRAAMRQVSGTDSVTSDEARSAVAHYRVRAQVSRRSVPTNVLQLAHEVAHFTQFGELPRLRGGSAENGRGGESDHPTPPDVPSPEGAATRSTGQSSARGVARVDPPLSDAERTSAARPVEAMDPGGSGKGKGRASASLDEQIAREDAAAAIAHAAARYRRETGETHDDGELRARYDRGEMEDDGAAVSGLIDVFHRFDRITGDFAAQESRSAEPADEAHPRPRAVETSSSTALPSSSFVAARRSIENESETGDSDYLTAHGSSLDEAERRDQQDPDGQRRDRLAQADRAVDRALNEYRREYGDRRTLAQLITERDRGRLAREANLDGSRTRLLDALDHERRIRSEYLDAHLRRAIRGTRTNPDLEAGGFARHATPRGVTLWVRRLTKTVSSAALYEDIAAHDDAHFLAALRSVGDMDDPGRTLLQGIRDDLDALRNSALAGLGDPSTRVSQTAALRLLQDHWAAANLSTTVAGLQHGFSERRWQSVAWRTAVLAGSLVAPYSVPLLPFIQSKRGDDAEFLYLAILASTHAKALLRFTGMFRHRHRVSYRVAREYYWDTMGVWLIPTLPFLPPAFLPWLTENVPRQADSEHEGQPLHDSQTEQPLPLTLLNKVYTSLATLITAGGYFTIGFPRAMVSPFTTAWDLLAQHGLSSNSADRRALATGRTSLPTGSDGDHGSGLTVEELNRIVSGVERKVAALDAVATMFTEDEEFGYHVSDNVQEQIAHLREDIADLRAFTDHLQADRRGAWDTMTSPSTYRHLGNAASTLGSAAITARTYQDLANAAIDARTYRDLWSAVRPAGPATAQKSAYLFLNLLVHAVATAAAAKTEPGAAFADYISEASFVAFLSAAELYDPAVDERGARNTFINYTAHEFFALIPAAISFGYPELWDTWHPAEGRNVLLSASFWLPFLTALSATYGPALSHGLVEAMIHLAGAASTLWTPPTRDAADAGLPTVAPPPPSTPDRSDTSATTPATIDAGNGAATKTSNAGDGSVVTPAGSAPTPDLPPPGRESVAKPPVDTQPEPTPVERPSATSPRESLPVGDETGRRQHDEPEDDDESLYETAPNTPMPSRPPSRRDFSELIGDPTIEAASVIAPAGPETMGLSSPTEPSAPSSTASRSFGTRRAADADRGSQDPGGVPVPEDQRRYETSHIASAPVTSADGAAFGGSALEAEVGPSVADQARTEQPEADRPAPGESAGRVLRVPFGEGEKTVLDDDTIGDFADYVVEQATSLHQAGGGRLELHAQGGGNGGVFSAGAREVGLQRAGEVLDRLNAFIGPRLESLDVVVTGHPESRGKAAPEGAEGTLGAARRLVMVRLVSQPTASAPNPIASAVAQPTVPAPDRDDQPDVQSPESRERTGDRWVQDADGIWRWGRYGAAGTLLRTWGFDGTPLVLLQRRAGWTDHGGTWGLPGGAREEGETPLHAALRETREETGLTADRVNPRSETVTARAPGIDWTYTTVIADAPYPVPVTSSGEGSSRWIRLDDVTDLPLHPGLAAVWKSLRAEMADRPLAPPRPSPQLDHSVDPTNVEGVYEIQNAEARLHFRDDDGLLYREDTRPPEVIFREGFATRSGLDRNSKRNLFVSTTRNPNLGYLRDDIARGQTVYRYAIDAPGGIDVNRTVGLARSQYQQEVSFPGGIRRENIVDAVEVSLGGQTESLTGSPVPGPPTSRYGNPTPNPYYAPNRPNTGAPPVWQGPLANASVEDSDADSAPSPGASWAHSDVQSTNPASDIARLYPAPFDRGVKTLGPGQQEDIRTIAAGIVRRAADRSRAGQSGVTVRVEGGGNGGYFSRGADVVGLARSQAVLNALRAEIVSMVAAQELDPHVIDVVETPTSRGVALVADVPGLDAEIRRTVVVRVGAQPDTPTRRRRQRSRPDSRRIISQLPATVRDDADDVTPALDEQSEADRPAPGESAGRVFQVPFGEGEKTVLDDDAIGDFADYVVEQASAPNPIASAVAEPTVPAPDRDDQPDVVANWRSESALDAKPRSAALRDLDATVASLQAARNDAGAMHAVLHAIAEWRTSKDGPSERDPAVDRLERAVERERERLTGPAKPSGAAPRGGRADGGRRLDGGPPSSEEDRKQLEKLERKYFPVELGLGVEHRADTIITPHVDGAAYFGAIADVLDGLSGPGDRLYVNSWFFDPATRLRTGSNEPNLGERLLTLADAGVDVRVVVAIPRRPPAPSPANPDPLPALLALGITHFASRNLASVEQMRTAVRNLRTPLADRIIIDWGGGTDTRHEKTTVAYNAQTETLHGFVGGIDYSPNRLTEQQHDGAATYNYTHDVGIELRGGAAVEVLRNFWTRWDEATTLPPRALGTNQQRPPVNPPSIVSKPRDEVPIIRDHAVHSSEQGAHGAASVRIWRTYGAHRVTPVNDALRLGWQTLPIGGVREVVVGLRRAIDAAERYVYVEDQTLNPSHLGNLYNKHTELFPVVARALNRGVRVIFVTQGFAGRGAPPGDATPKISHEINELILRVVAPENRANFSLFALRNTKVHSKVVLVDDEFAAIGSANFWDRSMTGDESEVTAAMVHPGRSQSLTASLRVNLWREHFRLPDTESTSNDLRDLDRSLGYFDPSWGSGSPADVAGGSLIRLVDPGLMSRLVNRVGRTARLDDDNSIAASTVDLLAAWRAESALSLLHPRSTELMAIDAALDRWQRGGGRRPAALDQDGRELRNVLDAIDRWEATKPPETSPRRRAVEHLRRTVLGELDAMAVRRDVVEGGPRGSADELFRQVGSVPVTVPALETVVDSAVPRVGADPSLAECGPLASWLVRALHPEGLRPLEASDDAVIDRGGATGQLGRVLAGPGWAQVADLESLRSTLQTSPGATAVVAFGRSGSRVGHVLALHSTIDGLRWVDPQAPAGRRVDADAPSPGWPDQLAGASAVFAVSIAPDGRIEQPGRWSEGGSAQALLDPVVRHDFGARHGDQGVDRRLTLLFGERSQTLDQTARQRITEYVQDLMADATRRGVVLTVHAEGGGNGGRRSDGAEPVGRARADRVLEEIGRQVANRQTHEPGPHQPGVVVTHHGTSRGMNPPSEADLSGYGDLTRRQTRRAVVVRAVETAVVAAAQRPAHEPSPAPPIAGAREDSGGPLGFLGRPPRNPPPMPPVLPAPGRSELRVDWPHAQRDEPREGRGRRDEPSGRRGRRDGPSEGRGRRDDPGEGRGRRAQRDVRPVDEQGGRRRGEARSSSSGEDLRRTVERQEWRNHSRARDLIDDAHAELAGRRWAHRVPSRALTDTLAEAQWWRLYIDPQHHREAERHGLVDHRGPGSLYDAQHSPGFQSLMVDAYRRFLTDSPTVGRRVDRAEYELMARSTGNYGRAVYVEGHGGWVHSLAAPTPAEDLYAESVGRRPLIDDGRTPGRSDALVFIAPPDDGLPARDPGRFFPRLHTLHRSDDWDGMVDAVLARHYAEIDSAHDDADRLRSIARLVRTLHVMHPYQDGNGRLHIYLLLPRLLMANGYEPVILEPASRLFSGGFSLDDISSALLWAQGRSVRDALGEQPDSDWATSWSVSRGRFGSDLGRGDGSSLPAAHTAESLAMRHPALALVNPDRGAAGGSTNCVLAALSFVMAEREGAAFRAPLGESLPGVDLVNFHRQSLGLADDRHNLFAVADFASAAEALAAAGEGAMALIAVRGAALIDHVLVGLVDEAGVSFVDPQRGGLAMDPTEATGLVMVPVTPGISMPERARMLNELEVTAPPEDDVTSARQRQPSTATDLVAATERTRSDATAVAQPEPEMTPQLPRRIGADLTLGGMDVMETFRSGPNGDLALDHLREVLTREADAQAWESHRQALTSMFADDALRPKAPGMLRGGRAVSYTLDVGSGRGLTIELRLDGQSPQSELRYQETVAKYEFEHSSDSTTDISRQQESRTTQHGGLQATLAHPHATDSASATVARERQVTLAVGRADRQVSGGQTTEPAVRFAGRIQAVMTVRRAGSHRPTDVVAVPYRVRVAVPARDVDADMAKTPPPRSGPAHVIASRALRGSDVVTNFWLLSPPTPTGTRTRIPTGDFVAGPRMAAAFAKAYGERAAAAMGEAEAWLTVERLQANLHGMTNKQPLRLEFESIDGGWMDVHAFVASPDGDGGSLMRATGSTAATEFHYGTETDVSQVAQDAVTWSAQLPTPGRFRGQGGTDAGEAVGGVDASAGASTAHTTTITRQFRTRATLKNPAPGHAWEGHVLLRFTMHAPGAVSPTGPDTAFRGAMVSTLGRFDALTEQALTTPEESYLGRQVWAPPRRIWGTAPAETNSIARGPWWRPGVGARTTDSATGPRPAFRLPHPIVARDDTTVGHTGLGSQDRVTNLDLGGFHGLLDDMGRRAFGASWDRSRAAVADAFHLNRMRAGMAAMTQHSPLTRTALSGPGSATSASVTADLHSLTYRRVIGQVLASPSVERTTGTVHTATDSRTATQNLALGGRGGDVDGRSVLGEVIAGENYARRDGDRVRRRERTVVATKFTQPMAVFEGWVRLDVAMVGSRATVHESALVPIEVAIPLRESPGWRTHDDEAPPQFDATRPLGFVHPDPPIGPPRPDLDWSPPPPTDAVQPPAHAALPAWHPADMIIGVDPASGIAEAIRQDLAPILGSKLDEAMVEINARLGAEVLAARLAHESGQSWELDVPAPGGALTVTVRPVREPGYDYLGGSDTFEADLSTESQASHAHLRGATVRRVLGGRVQIPFPHGSVAVQVTNTRSPNAFRRDNGATGDAGQSAESNAENTTSEVEERIPARQKTASPHDLFRQPIRFELSYSARGAAKLLGELPAAPPPVRLGAVFAYPRHAPAPVGESVLQDRPHLHTNQMVLAIRPRNPDGSPFTARDARDPDATPTEDLIATHVLKSIAPEGVAVFGSSWPRVRAELSDRFATMAVQGSLGALTRGATTVVDVTSGRGGRVRIDASLTAIHSAQSVLKTEFYSGGQRVHATGSSNSTPSTWQGYVQVQGDLLPGVDAVNVSAAARLDGGAGRETTVGHTESSATGLLSRQKTASADHVGQAMLRVTMSSDRGPGPRRSAVGTALIEIHTRENPRPPTPGAPPVSTEFAGRPLEQDVIVRDPVGGDALRAEALSALRTAVGFGDSGSLAHIVEAALGDAALASTLPEMTRGDVVLLRRGPLLVTGRAEVVEMRHGHLEHDGGHVNVLNEVNQGQQSQQVRSREGGLRLYLGPRVRLPGLSVTVQAGGGAAARLRSGPTASQNAKVSANSKVARGHAVFDGTLAITLSVRRSGRTIALAPRVLHGQVLVPDAGPAAPAVPRAVSPPRVESPEPMDDDPRVEPAAASVGKGDADAATRLPTRTSTVSSGRTLVQRSSTRRTATARGGTLDSIPEGSRVAMSTAELTATADGVAASAGDCGALVTALLARLHPAGIRPLSASDDGVIELGGAVGTRGRVVAGGGWARVGDPAALRAASNALRPGATVVMVTSPLGGGVGHVVAMYASSDGLHWVDPQRGPGERVGPAAGVWPVEAQRAAAVWAAVIDEHGSVQRPGRWSQPNWVVDALTDADLTRRHGAHQGPRVSPDAPHDPTAVSAWFDSDTNTGPARSRATLGASAGVSRGLPIAEAHPDGTAPPLPAEPGTTAEPATPSTDDHPGIDLDYAYGPLVAPRRIKSHEWDLTDDARVQPQRLQLNSVFYRLEDMPRAVLANYRDEPWNFAVDAAGGIRIGVDGLGAMLTDAEMIEQYNAHRGAAAAIDPQAPSEAAAMALEEFEGPIGGLGHPTIAVEFDDGGRVSPGRPRSRVAGEITWNAQHLLWEISDASGRYMSTTVRPYDPAAVTRWLRNVAGRLSAHFGEPVEVAPRTHRPGRRIKGAATPAPTDDP